MKTTELTGAALDWAVAKFETDLLHIGHQSFAWGDARSSSDMERVLFTPSTNWAQGGPIIEREGITIAKDGSKWLAMTQSNGIMQWGKSYLVAAMRCYVASKLGEKIEIPEELK